MYKWMNCIEIENNCLFLFFFYYYFFVVIFFGFLFFAFFLVEIFHLIKRKHQKADSSGGRVAQTIKIRPLLEKQ